MKIEDTMRDEEGDWEVQACAVSDRLNDDGSPEICVVLKGNGIPLTVDNLPTGVERRVLVLASPPKVNDEMIAETYKEGFELAAGGGSESAFNPTIFFWKTDVFSWAPRYTKSSMNFPDQWLEDMRKQQHIITFMGYFGGCWTITAAQSFGEQIVEKCPTMEDLQACINKHVPTGFKLTQVDRSSEFFVGVMTRYPSFVQVREHNPTHPKSAELINDWLSGDPMARNFALSPKTTCTVLVQENENKGVLDHVEEATLGEGGMLDDVLESKANVLDITTGGAESEISNILSPLGASYWRIRSGAQTGVVNVVISLNKTRIVEGINVFFGDDKVRAQPQKWKVQVTNSEGDDSTAWTWTTVWNEENFVPKATGRDVQGSEDKSKLDALAQTLKAKVGMEKVFDFHQDDLTCVLVDKDSAITSDSEFDTIKLPTECHTVCIQLLEAGGGLVSDYEIQMVQIIGLQVEENDLLDDVMGRAAEMKSKAFSFFGK